MNRARGRTARKLAGTDLAAELNDLRTRLAEAEEILHSIRVGDVDALVVYGEHGEHVYTLGGSDRAYRQHVETMSGAAVTLSVGGMILYCNTRMAQLLDRPLDKVLGSLLRNSLPPADQERFDAVLLQTRTAPSRVEMSVRTDAGRIMPVELSASVLPTEGTDVVFCLALTDLTERRHEEVVAAERLARSILEQAAEPIVVCDARGHVLRASRAAQKFCAGPPIGQPFESAFALHTGARAMFGLAPVLAGETLRDVDVSVDRDGRTFALILNAGPLLSGEQAVGCVVTLTDITERIALDVCVAPDVPGWVIGDPTRLRQILLNVLSNALKFTARGRVAIAVRREPQSAAGGCDVLRFEVSDTGIGIAPDKQHLLFEDFAQADPCVARTYGGTGLGLSISRRLVQAMGGTMGLTSTVGTGSVFWFTALLPTAAPPPSVPARSSTSTGVAPRRILLVDDNVLCVEQ